MGVVGTPEITDDLANRMSLFYANPTPMLNTISNATSRLIKEGVSVCVCVCVCVCMFVCVLIQ